jgi:hypothetical protein
VVEEVVGEELLGGAELAVGSAGWGNNGSGLLLTRRSQRKTMVGKSHRPASLVGTAGMLLVQEGHGDEAPLLAQSDGSGRLIGNEQRWVKQRSAWSRAARSAAEWGRGESGVGDGFLGNV